MQHQEVHNLSCSTKGKRQSRSLVLVFGENPANKKQAKISVNFNSVGKKRGYAWRRPVLTSWRQFLQESRGRVQNFRNANGLWSEADTFWERSTASKDRLLSLHLVDIDEIRGTLFFLFLKIFHVCFSSNIWSKYYMWLIQFRLIVIFRKKSLFTDQVR